MCRHLRSPVPAHPLQESRLPGSAPYPCAPQLARERADSLVQRRRGRAERPELSYRAARRPSPASPGCRGARQRRAGARGCVTARSQSRREGAARPTVRFPSVAPAAGWTRRGRRALAAALGPRRFRAVVPGDSGRRGPGAARRRRTFSQGGGCSAPGRGRGPATAGAAESLGVGGGVRDGAGGTGERGAAAAGGPVGDPGPGATPAPARPAGPRRRAVLASDAGRPARLPPGASSRPGAPRPRPRAAAPSPRWPL